MDAFIEKIKKDESTIKEINLRTIDTLVAELNAHGHVITKPELISLAKQQSASSGTADGTFVLVSQVLVV